ncbi:MAG: hypothetical protein MUP63_03160 [Candidatus Nanohaloarchaeota archaeon QJJ-7]|nr:hypothetical protein [Candidatus Nanohaloarchaeota archaeon QJJ-7]
MADVEKVLDRLKREFIKVNLIQASLDSLVIFLGLNLVLFLFGFEISPVLSDTLIVAFLGLGVFFIDLAYRAHHYHLEIYERRNPELREILRTARDNPQPKNLATRAMAAELMKRLKKVTSDSIVPRRSIIQKILLVGVLSFLTLLSGVTDFRLQESSGTILPDLEHGEEEDEKVLKNSSEVFGEREEIDASDLDLEFNITGEGERSSEPPDRSLSGSGDAVLESASSALEEDLLLAKRYSLALKDLGE